MICTKNFNEKQMVNADLAEFFKELGIEPSLSLCEFIWEGESGRIEDSVDYRCQVSAHIQIFYQVEKLAEALDREWALPISSIKCVISERPLSKQANPSFDGTELMAFTIAPETRGETQFVAGEQEDQAQILINITKDLKLVFSGSHESDEQE